MTVNSNMLDVNACLSSFSHGFFRANANSAAENSIYRPFLLARGETLKLAATPQPSYIFLVQGSIELRENDGIPRMLNQTGKRLYSLTASVEISVPGDLALFFHVDAEKRDELVSWQDFASLVQTSNKFSPTHLHALKSKSLSNLPLERVFNVLDAMEIVEVEAGQEIMKQGETGNYFYIVDSGVAEVWQRGLYDDVEKHVATLHQGDQFGEEALITGGTRTATVKMQTAGRLLAIEKDVFASHIASPFIEEVEADVAKSMLDGGHQLIDVRYEEEHEESHIPGARLIPLHELRQRFDELNPAGNYLIYCRSGRRSAVATMLLRQRNIKAFSLKGGLRDWPFEKNSAW